VGLAIWHSLYSAELPDTLAENAENFAIKGISFRVLYPAYIGKSPDNFKKLPKKMPLPRGSRLEIYIQEKNIFDQAQDKTYFKIKNEKNLLRWFSYKDRWMSSLNPSQSGYLVFDWKRPAPVKYLLNIVPDLPPKLSVIWPNTTKIFSNSQLSIQLSVSDDYGLHQITLYYQADGKKIEKEIIQSFEGHFKKYQETYPWELGSTSLKRDDQVKAWIEVSDIDTLNGPNITVSDPFEFKVQSIKKFHKSLMERFWEINRDLGKLLDFLDQKNIDLSDNQETQIIEKLNNLRHDSYYDTMLSQELKNYIYELQSKLNYYRKNRKKAGGTRL
jgi:hypothetical protein